MRRLEKVTVSALRVVCGICLLSIVGCVALQVLTRYVFEFPLSWTEESSRFLLVWMVFLGSIVTLSKDENIRLTLLASRLSGRPLQALFAFVYAVTGAFNVLFALGSYRMAKLNWRLPALTIPGFFLGYLHLASAASAVVIVLICVIRLVSSIRAAVLGEGPRRSHSPGRR